MTYRILLVTASALLFNLSTATASANDYADLDLEPCLNSEISANGRYAYERDSDDLALEPAINGEVSNNGRFASQSEADAYLAERG